jgi:hypothetical protein
MRDDEHDPAIGEAEVPAPVQPRVYTVTLTDGSQWVLHEAWLQPRSSREVVRCLRALGEALNEALALVA